MGLDKPLGNFITDFLCQQKHLFRFLVGGDSCPLIFSDVSLLPELIKVGDQVCGRIDRMGEGLDDPVVVDSRLAR
jgi:hypothetical protein